MKKVIFAICMLCTGAAFAANEESITSREYVDAGLGTKQDTLTTTGTGAMTFDSSETDGIGQKAIYNPNGDYATQQDALVSASTANAAVQNAIAAEFVCIAWKNNDPNDECLLVQIQNRTTPTKNLFDISKIPTRISTTSTSIINNGDGSITVTTVSNNSAVTTDRKLSQLAPELVAGRTYTLSFKTTGTDKYALLYCYDDTSNHTTWGTGRSKVITADLLDCYVFFYASGVNTTATISDIQIEEGTTATPYVPYGNTYMPTGN
ncbi:MAG: hypothetical protein J6T57_03340 [Alphaproteobacteria bacterium]|nr:hypothetical protein [Alphaproteobacteria bacterium]